MLCQIASEAARLCFSIELLNSAFINCFTPPTLPFGRAGSAYQTELDSAKTTDQVATSSQGPSGTLVPMSARFTIIA